MKNIAKGLGLCLAFLCLNFATIYAQCTDGELLSNGGFETGAYPPWTIGNQVVSLGDGIECTGSLFSAFHPTIPAINNCFAWNLFDTSISANAVYTVCQDVTIPTGATSATLSFDWYATFDYTNFGAVATASRTVDIEIIDQVTGAVLFSQLVYEADFLQGVELGTGWTNESYDLSSFAGQSVSTCFEFFIPEILTGPAIFAYDNVSLDIQCGGMVDGCTDNLACNFDPLATSDDGSCLVENDPCDDANSNTFNDLIDSNCVCTGTPFTGFDLSIIGPCNCFNGVDLDGDGENDLAQETITLSAGMAPYSVAVSGLLDASGNTLSNAAVQALITSADPGSGAPFSFSAYIAANSLDTYTLTITDGNNESDTVQGGPCTACLVNQVPTVSEWGLLCLALSLLSLITVFIKRRESLTDRLEGIVES